MESKKEQLDPTSRITVFSPAKINLTLSITGKREDGYHDLISLVTLLDFGDEVTIEKSETSQTHINCSMQDVPLDEDNLAFQAVNLFKSLVPQATGHNFEITLNKKIPTGAGLGGGSSNATAVLKALNELYENPLSSAQLLEIAAKVGSDCPLFLEPGPKLMTGRGERIEKLQKPLNKSKFLIFKPDFSINTAWAYSNLAQKLNGNYTNTSQAQNAIAQAYNGVFSNDFEVSVFHKYLIFNDLCFFLSDSCNMTPTLCGSGSACFCPIKADSDVRNAKSYLRHALGEGIFMVETAST